MLSTEMPMNNPNKPPQLAKNSDIVEVSDRFVAMKWSFLNEICTWLLIPLKLENKVDFTWLFRKNIFDSERCEVIYRVSLNDRSNALIVSKYRNEACVVSTLYSIEVQSGKKSLEMESPTEENWTVFRHSASNIVQTLILSSSDHEQW